MCRNTSFCQKENNDQDQSQLEAANLKLSVNSMKEEVNNLQRVIAAKDSRLLELENKLIQERLKSEQIKRDLIKSEETFKETKTSLNEQINKNHDDLRTIEHLETELIETRKKYRESKKLLKKAETQLAKTQSQLQEEQAQKAKLEQSLLEQKTESTKLDDTSGSSKPLLQY